MSTVRRAGARGQRAKKKSFLCLVCCLIQLGVCSLGGSLQAKVTGNCSNCHTMHNSQNGVPVVRDGAGAGWNSAGNLSGGSIDATPQQHLLVSSCVGCHTSTTSQTIMNIGGSRVPIVFNTVAPANPLAGGNFYWIAQGNDALGHNVLGISPPDSTLQTAPGKAMGCAVIGCHDTLAQTPQSAFLLLPNKGGCDGCHVFTYHHDDNGVYRFLKGHGGGIVHGGGPGLRDITVHTDYVTGVEDPDWEQTATSAKHNYYKGTTVLYNDATGLQVEHSITAFCSGCHGKFHGPQSGGSGMGSSSPWFRHPTDVILPQTGEYGAYAPTTAYSNVAPVAYTDPSNPSRSTAVVMCLSCHRAHGSPYPKIMRWDYKNWPGNGQTNGCNVCHTSKN